MSRPMSTAHQLTSGQGASRVPSRPYTALMPRESAGILFYRHAPGGPEVLLVHPGGPFWKNKDLGAWSIPKGEIEPDESPLAASLREVQEELGPDTVEAQGEPVPLPSITLKSRKVVHAWLCAGAGDVARLKSNTFQLEWPPKSGKFADFPEVDRAAWFPLAEARQKIHPSQLPLLAAAQDLLSRPP